MTHTPRLPRMLQEGSQVMVLWVPGCQCCKSALCPTSSKTQEYVSSSVYAIYQGNDGSQDSKGGMLSKVMQSATGEREGTLENWVPWEDRNDKSQKYQRLGNSEILK